MSKFARLWRWEPSLSSIGQCRLPTGDQSNRWTCAWNNHVTHVRLLKKSDANRWTIQWSWSLRAMLSSWTFLGPKEKSAEKRCLGPSTKKTGKRKFNGKQTRKSNIVELGGGFLYKLGWEDPPECEDPSSLAGLLNYSIFWGSQLLNLRICSILFWKIILVPGFVSIPKVQCHLENFPHLDINFLSACRSPPTQSSL